MKKSSLQQSDAHFGQAWKHYESGDIDSAIKSLECAIELVPDHFEALADLGNLLNQRERYTEAEAVLHKACSIIDEDASVYYCLGKSVKHQNRIEEAIDYYIKCSELEKEDTQLLNLTYAQLTVLLRKYGHVEEATFYYKKWLEVAPNNPVPIVFLKILSKANLEQLPEDFIRQEFNSFSTTYNRTLEKLNYSGPKVISQKISAHLPQPKKSLCVLDLGCGTGLCGTILRPYAKLLIGVDLAGKMLDKARSLGVYDRLAETEATLYLKTHLSVFDVIVAADVFPYFGNVRELLSAINTSLKSNGLFVFNFERQNKWNRHWQISSNGRFAHSVKYIRKLLRKSDIKEISYEACDYREEGGSPVPGAFIVAKKH